MTKKNLLLWCALPFTLVLALYYFFFDPVSTSWAPKCITYSLTGLQCPGCGSQRMMHALFHGDFEAAWHFNPFLICFLPVIATMAFAAATRTRFPRLYSMVNSLPVIIGVAVSLVLWTILRNIF